MRACTRSGTANVESRTRFDGLTEIGMSNVEGNDGRQGTRLTSMGEAGRLGVIGRAATGGVVAAGAGGVEETTAARGGASMSRSIIVNPLDLAGDTGWPDWRRDRSTSRIG